MERERRKVKIWCSEPLPYGIVDLDDRILKQQQEEEERKRQRKEKKKEKKVNTPTGLEYILVCT